MDFRIVVSISKGKEMTSFDGDYIKSVDKFENYFHCNKTKLSNPWTWAIFLFILSFIFFDGVFNG